MNIKGSPVPLLVAMFLTVGAVAAAHAEGSSPLGTQAVPVQQAIGKAAPQQASPSCQ